MILTVRDKEVQLQDSHVSVKGASPSPLLPVVEHTFLLLDLVQHPHGLLLLPLQLCTHTHNTHTQQFYMSAHHCTVTLQDSVKYSMYICKNRIRQL